MDASIIVAIVALLGAALSAAMSLYGQFRSTSLAAQREAEAVLAKYREPLVAAAYELQARLYNILELKFLEKYYLAGNDRKTYAVENTLYVIAQYFGWSEILRREIQFLSFLDNERTRTITERQRRIVALFQSDDPSLGQPFLVWRGEQRAIGELMIESETRPAQCLGYASFCEQREPGFRRWFKRLEGDLEDVARGAAAPRLPQLQHALVELIRALDPQGVRYSDDVLKKV